VADDAAAPVQAHLLAFLHDVLPWARDLQVTGLHQLGGGSSRENWPFRLVYITRDGRQIEKDLVLRRDPPVELLENARQDEYDLLRGLQRYGLPTPEALWADATGGWLDRPSIIMRRYEGFSDRRALTARGSLGLSEDERVGLARQFCVLLTRLHTLNLADWDPALPKPPVARGAAVLAEWERKLAAVALEPQPDLVMAQWWLRAHVPEAVPARLVHGDFRPGNALLREGSIEVLLDWEMAHLGDPVEDVGWYLSPFYRREHFIPGRFETADFLATYQELSGVPVPQAALDFWVVMSAFKICVLGLSVVRMFCEQGAYRVSTPVPRLYEQLLRAIDDIETRGGP
jgi:aminoglycoside phosphotransferase (APT) family kinase protein